MKINLKKGQRWQWGITPSHGGSNYGVGICIVEILENKKFDSTSEVEVYCKTIQGTNQYKFLSNEECWEFGGNIQKYWTLLENQHKPKK